MIMPPTGDDLDFAVLDGSLAGLEARIERLQQSREELWASQVRVVEARVQLEQLRTLNRIAAALERMGAIFNDAPGLHEYP